MEVKDAQVKISVALPNGAATATPTAGIDTGKVDTGSIGYQEGDFEFILTAPALTTVQQPDGKTTIYNIITSANSDLSAPTTLMPAVITQTGAGSAGSAAATYRFRLPSNSQRYVGFNAVGSTTGDNSAKTATLEGLF